MDTTANSFFSLISSLLGIYNFIIFVRILLSWKYNNRAVNPQDQFQGIYLLLCKITDPYLNIFRNVKGLKKGMLDFSPLLALVLLNIVQSIFKVLAIQNSITVGIVLALIVTTLWEGVISWVMIILIIVLGVRLYFEGKQNNKAIGFVNIIDKILNGMMHRIYNIFYKGKMISDTRLIRTALILNIIIYIVLRIVVSLLVGVLM